MCNYLCTSFCNKTFAETFLGLGWLPTKKRTSNGLTFLLNVVKWSQVSSKYSHVHTLSHFPLFSKFATKSRHFRFRGDNYPWNWSACSLMCLARSFSICSLNPRECMSKKQMVFGFIKTPLLEIINSLPPWMAYHWSAQVHLTWIFVVILIRPIQTCLALEIWRTLTDWWKYTIEMLYLIWESDVMD